MIKYGNKLGVLDEIDTIDSVKGFLTDTEKKVLIDKIRAYLKI